MQFGLGAHKNMNGYNVKREGEKAESIIEMFVDGYTYRDISKKLKIKYAFVRHMVISMFGYDKARSIRRINLRNVSQKNMKKI